MADTKVYLLTEREIFKGLVDHLEKHNVFINIKPVEESLDTGAPLVTMNRENGNVFFEYESEWYVSSLICEFMNVFNDSDYKLIITDEAGDVNTFGTMEGPEVVPHIEFEDIMDSEWEDFDPNRIFIKFE